MVGLGPLKAWGGMAWQGRERKGHGPVGSGMLGNVPAGHGMVRRDKALWNDGQRLGGER